MTTSAHPGARARVLVAADDPKCRDELAMFLGDAGYLVEAAGDAPEALTRAAATPPDLVVVDLNAPGTNGLELVQQLRARNRELPVVVVAASVELRDGVAVMRAGAADYLTKPVDAALLTLSIERALPHRNVGAEKGCVRPPLREPDADGLHGLVGAGTEMQRIYGLARRVAASHATVLITGESGTGKGVVARAIHALGERAERPFVALHCAALAPSLLESELFGHEKGSFTGAAGRHLGRFEQANGGTIFLDEIGEIPPLTQVKLLQALQERSFQRVGGNETIEVDVRVIAATHRDLAMDVSSGRFREDLYYRLKVVHIDMPPLRVRGSDVVLLSNHFLHKFAVENGKQVDGFTDPARAKIASYQWPGNVRELENAIERAVVLAEGRLVEETDLPLERVIDTHAPIRIPGATLAAIERYAVVRTLEVTAGSTARTAEILGVSIRTIQKRLNDYGVVAKSARPRPPSLPPFGSQ